MPNKVTLDGKVLQIVSTGPEEQLLQQIHAQQSDDEELSDINN